LYTACAENAVGKINHEKHIKPERSEFVNVEGSDSK
jgi:hypothetical protein